MSKGQRGNLRTVGVASRRDGTNDFCALIRICLCVIRGRIRLDAPVLLRLVIAWALLDHKAAIRYAIVSEAQIGRRGAHEHAVARIGGNGVQIGHAQRGRIDLTIHGDGRAAHIRNPDGLKLHHAGLGQAKLETLTGADAFREFE